MKYYDKFHKSMAAKGQVKDEGLSIGEAECHLDAGLFLDEYPRWKAGGPTTHSSSRGCSCLPQSQGRRRWSDQYMEATGKVSQG